MKNQLHLYDEPEYRALSQFVRSGDLVVDVGTNMGQYASRLAELVGASGKVIGFEAVPATYRLARRVLRRFPNVEIHNLALSSAPGRVRMALFFDRQGQVRTGLSSVAETALLTNPDAMIEVRAITLDSAIKLRERPISFIKCDVEGHEIEVLRGASDVLTNDRPLILCEVHPSHLDRMQSYLRTMKYRLFQLAEEGLVPASDGFRGNYFLVPLEFGAWRSGRRRYRSGP